MTDIAQTPAKEIKEVKAVKEPAKDSKKAENIRRSATVESDKSSLALLKRSISYFTPYKMHLAIAVLCMILTSLGEGAMAYLVQPAFDNIFASSKQISDGSAMPVSLYLIPLAFLVVTIFKSATRLGQNYMMQYAGLRVLEVLRDEMYQKIIKLPLKYYEGTQVGMLMSRILGDVSAVRSSLPAVVMFVRQILTMLALMGVVFYQNLKLAVIAMVVLPLAFYPFMYFSKRMRKLSRKNYAQSADISVLLQEILSGIRVVKAFCTEDSEGHRMDGENKRLMILSMKQTLASNLSTVIMDIVGSAALGLVIFYGGLQVISGEITTGAFFSFITALGLLYDPVKKMADANNTIQGALAGAERVFDILDSEEIVIEKEGAYALDEPFEELCFNNVTFFYGPEKAEALPLPAGEVEANGAGRATDGENTTGTVSLAPALKTVSFSIKKGEKVAIVGPSGAGKSTFVNLIPRFYDPSAGSITLNGRDLRDYTLSSLRRNVAVVSQDSFLFNVSLRENIAYGHQGEIEQEAVEAAARAAYAHDFILCTAEGYDTIVGERGVKMSGGQKQRVTIARAIMKDAPLLILDEATSALDSESEQIVQKALENLMEHRTSIVIAHRLSTVLGSDRIIVMEGGSIVGVGKHEELLETNPLYAKLYAMQFKTDDIHADTTDLDE